MPPHLNRDVVALVRENIEHSMVNALGPLGLSGCWNDLFWAVHPGGRAILDSVEEGLRLAPEKLAASRHVPSEYGNMSGPTVIFVLSTGSGAAVMSRRLGATVWVFCLGSDLGSQLRRWCCMPVQLVKTRSTVKAKLAYMEWFFRCKSRP